MLASTTRAPQQFRTPPPNTCRRRQMLASTTRTPPQFRSPPPNTCRRRNQPHFHSLLCNHKRHYNLAVGANAYARAPLETAGAYRLIDENTGESFIVWGGEDDEESNDVSIPPSPPPPLPAGDSITQIGAASALRRSGSDVRAGGVRKSAAIGSFGKLKAQRVRALIRRTAAKRSHHHLSSVGGEKDAALPRLLEEDEEVVADGDGTDFGARDSNFVRAIEKGDSLRSKTGASAIAAGSRPSRGWGSAPPPVDAGVRGRFNRKQQRKRKNKAVDGGFFSRKTFKELGCSDDMVEALRSQRFHRPSHIQAMSYPPVLQGKSCIVADQSGSGKTLAYLGPVIQSLRQDELQGLGKSYPKNPRLLVLLPTAELASQVLNNCRSISKYGVPFRSMVATGGFRQKTQLESLQQELDVLIATPGRFIYLLKEGFLELSNLKSVVLDEVDILFSDEDFEEVLKSLINSAPVTTQYLFVTATLPVDIYNKLVEIFPDCEVIMGPGMHRTSSGLEEILVDCSGEGDEKTPETAFLNKKAALLQLVEESLVPKTIIFCNKIETCRKVENILKRTDRKGCRIRVLPFHSAMEQETRLAHMKEFLDPKSNESLFLICTDRASRGMDFANVDHVVLFDFPRNPSEYVRRVGRTARGAGGEGRAFVFAVGKQVSLAHKIIQRNEKGHPLHDVPSAYELESSIF